jgi:hypothetical protein
MKTNTSNQKIIGKGEPPPPRWPDLRAFARSNSAIAASTFACASSGEARSCATTPSVPAIIAPSMSPAFSFGIICPLIMMIENASVRTGSRP